MESIPPVANTQPQQIVINQKKRSAFGKLVSALGVLVIIFSIMLNFMLMAAVAVSQDGMGMKLKKTLYQKGEDKQVVAVYEVNDAITAQSVQQFSKFYREVSRDDKVKAVVLRVNSPGGGAAASDEIWHMVEGLKAKGKKVVASFGAVAASGGYYISASADTIMAEPTTITGSIGVIMTLPNLEGTMDKLGINMTTLMSSNAKYWKDMGSPFKKLSPRAREALLGLLNDMQGQFENVVKDGRGSKLKITKKSVKEPIVKDGVKSEEVIGTETIPFNGQIFRAKDALAIGLVDKIGYFEDAWAEAAKLANLSKPKVVKYHRRGGLFIEMMESFTPIKAAAEKTSSPQILFKWEIN